MEKFAWTEAASSAGGVETLLPLLPPTLDAPAMPEKATLIFNFFFPKKMSNQVSGI